MVKEPKGVPVVKAAVEKIKVWVLKASSLISNCNNMFANFNRLHPKYKGLTIKISKTQK
jgi:hypothetical protein